MRAYRQAGKIVIEIEERALLDGVHLCPGNENGTVTDPEKFLNFVANQICGIGDDGDFCSCSDMTRLIDNLVTYAIESDEGIEC